MFATRAEPVWWIVQSTLVCLAKVQFEAWSGKYNSTSARKSTIQRTPPEIHLYKTTVSAGLPMCTWRRCSQLVFRRSGRGILSMSYTPWPRTAAGPKVQSLPSLLYRHGQQQWDHIFTVLFCHLPILPGSRLTVTLGFDTTSSLSFLRETFHNISVKLVRNPITCV